jgi:hypothetical protein
MDRPLSEEVRKRIALRTAEDYLFASQGVAARCPVLLALVTQWGVQLKGGGG